MMKTVTKSEKSDMFDGIFLITKDLGPQKHEVHVAVLPMYPTVLLKSIQTPHSKVFSNFLKHCRRISCTRKVPMWASGPNGCDAR